MSLQTLREPPGGTKPVRWLPTNHQTDQHFHRCFSAQIVRIRGSDWTVKPITTMNTPNSPFTGPLSWGASRGVYDSSPLGSCSSPSGVAPTPTGSSSSFGGSSKRPSNLRCFIFPASLRWTPTTIRFLPSKRP